MSLPATTFRGKSLLRALTTIPFVLPTMVVAAAFTALLGPRGHLNPLADDGLWAWRRRPFDLQHTLALVLIAHVFYNAAIIVRLVGGFWANLDPRIEEAARVLGAGRWRTFREVTLPLLLPSIVAASLLVFLFCFTSFGVILVLGGPQLATIEVEIYYQAVPLFNLPLAAALSIVQMVFTFAIMAVYTRIQARAAVPLNLRPGEATQRRPASLGGAAGGVEQRRRADGPASGAAPGPRRPLLLSGRQLHPALLSGPLYQSHPVLLSTCHLPRRSAIRCSSQGARSPFPFSLV